MTRRTWRWLLPLTVVAVLLATGIAHFASEKPDGLEAVAERQGFQKKEKVHVKAPMPDYALPGAGSAVGRTLAGLAGVAVTFGVVLGVGWVVRRRRPTETDPDEPEA